MVTPRLPLQRGHRMANWTKTMTPMKPTIEITHNVAVAIESSALPPIKITTATRKQASPIPPAYCSLRLTYWRMVMEASLHASLREWERHGGPRDRWGKWSNDKRSLTRRPAAHAV